MEGIILSISEWVLGILVHCHGKKGGYIYDQCKQGMPRRHMVGTTLKDWLGCQKCNYGYSSVSPPLIPLGSRKA